MRFQSFWRQLVKRAGLLLDGFRGGDFGHVHRSLGAIIAKRSTLGTIGGGRQENDSLQHG